jgi:hypothetical protein
MKISDLQFTAEMKDNAWRGHRVEMPKTDAQRCIGNPEAAALFIAKFGDVEIVKDDYYGHWTVAAFAESREEYSKAKQAYCNEFGSN